MSNVIDLTDKRFGRLVVIDKSSTNSRGCVTWKCKCDCGNIVVKPGDIVTNDKGSKLVAVENL